MAITRPVPTFRAKMIGGHIVYADKGYYESYARGLEGKLVRITIEEFFEPINPDLRALYFGIIIRGACMQSEIFSTYTDEMEIHNILARELRSAVIHVKAKGSNTTMITSTKVDNVLEYNNSDFSRYVNDVIMYLETEHGIFIKHYEDYKIDKIRQTRRER